MWSPILAKDLNIGFKFGIAATIGKPLTRFGLELGGYAQYQHFQFTLQTHAFYHLKSFGPKGTFKECQITESVSYLFGKKQKQTSNLFFFHAASQYSNYAQHIGYGLKQYLDTRKTSQSSAMFFYGHSQWIIVVENDAFLFSYKDKFRTGGIRLLYNWSNQHTSDLFKYHQLGMHITLFTGDALHANAVRIKDTSYKNRHGYMDLSNAPLGKYAHGIWSVDYSTSMIHAQNISVGIGLDDERIRHVIQNKIIHDMVFIPKKWDKFNNPHIPMLQKNGMPFTYKLGEHIAPTRIFWKLSLNDPLFY